MILTEHMYTPTCLFILIFQLKFPCWESPGVPVPVYYMSRQPYRSSLWIHGSSRSSQYRFNRERTSLWSLAWLQTPDAASVNPQCEPCRVGAKTSWGWGMWTNFWFHILSLPGTSWHHKKKMWSFPQGLADVEMGPQRHLACLWAWLGDNFGALILFWSTLMWSKSKPGLND